jgi:DNA-3-methyladenine glycosylase
MARRRAGLADVRRLTSGPAKLTEALGITGRDDGADLTRGALRIDAPDTPCAFRTGVGPRVGITRAVELPLRFWVRDSAFVSRA